MNGDAQHGRPPLVHLEGSGYKVAEGDPDVRGWAVIGQDGRRIGEVDDLLVDTHAMKVRYLEVRLDRDLLASDRATGDARMIEGEDDPDATVIPELDSLSNLGGIIGMAAIPGAPDTVLGGNLPETLIRQTLSEEENRLTAGRHIGEHPYEGERHILVPVGRARLDTDEDRVFVDALSAQEALSLPAYDRGTVDRAYEARLRQAFDRSYAGEAGGDFYQNDDLYDEGRFYGPRRSRTEALPARER